MARFAGRTAAAAAVAGVVLGALTVAATPDTAYARRRRPPPLPAVVGVQTPLGEVGRTGPGGNVVVQYGIDFDGGGAIDDAEYRPATEAVEDPRGTRAPLHPRLYASAGPPGAGHAFVWDSVADFGFGVYGTLSHLVTDAGRFVPDPAHPGEFLFSNVSAGIRLRFRPFAGAGRRRVVGPWTYTDAFSLDNDIPPRVRIDSVRERDDGLVEIVWTVFDPDTEDRNGNGLLDPGEDANGNGLLDREQVGVHFDFHPVQWHEGEDPASMTVPQLEKLVWKPCTRAAGEGDTDSFREPPPRPGERDLRVFGTPTGSTWTFVWDGEPDLLVWYDPCVLRARCVDSKKRRGEFAYRLDWFALR